MALVEQNTFSVIEELIQEITARIVREWHPHKIILFGSHAKGKPKAHSDLDFMIIMDSAVARPDERAMQMERDFEDLDCPIDFFVYTPDEVAISLKKRNPFVKDILQKGRVLYADSMNYEDWLAKARIGQAPKVPS